MKYEYKIESEQHLFTSEHKIKWCGYGEWIEEPDEVTLEYKGYQAKVHRVFVTEPYVDEEYWYGGHLCGYVRIPNDHAYYGKENIDLECHGGLTFNTNNIRVKEHWVGFDCAHSLDYVPSIEYMKRTLPELISIREKFTTPEVFDKFILFNTTYRNVQYVIDSCVGIIDQLIQVTP